ncbi:long-chain-fatty-acid--CoA ligase [Bacillus tianshenii]|nr:long-chain-fatty-acid--CoA ligase [Bacillus tianshenii]
MLDNAIMKHPNREAIVMGSFRQTYQQIGETVHHLAGTLSQHYGIKKGDRVALLLHNCPEFIQFVFACARLGAIVVPLNTRLSEKELSFMLNHSTTKLLVASTDSSETINQLNLENECHFIYLSKQNEKVEEMTLQKLLQLYSTPYELKKVEIFETDPLFIMFTSGTTGTPKGAIGSHAGIIHSAMNYREVLKPQEKTRTLIAVPLFHVTGLIGQMFFMVLIGGTSVLLERFQTEPFIRTMHDEKITFLFNVPTIYIMVMSHPLFQKHTYPSVKVIAYGGAPMSQETIEQLRKAFPGVHLHNAYGATETSSPATIMPVTYDDSKLSSVGQPVPVADMKIVSDDGEELPPNQIGELYIKGPMVVEGYWDNEEANKKAFEDGYWKSGDMALIDDERFVYIMDRKKDMINRAGENIYSVEVENVLYEHEAVLEAAVVGVPDEMFGEQVKAFIVKKPEKKVEIEELKQYVKERIADYKVPKHIEFIDKLPRNPGGKILKARLSRMHQSNYTA